jgi:hypothetical protein
MFQTWTVLFTETAAYAYSEDRVVVTQNKLITSRGPGALAFSLFVFCGTESSDRHGPPLCADARRVFGGQRHARQSARTLGCSGKALKWKMSDAKLSSQSECGDWAEPVAAVAAVAQTAHPLSVGGEC